MDSLDLPTHQLILDGLALNLAEDIANVPSARARVRVLFAQTATSSKVTTGSKLFLSASAARTQISLALFASSISSASRSTEHTTDVKNDEHLAPVLDDLETLLRQLTLVDFDHDMSWSQQPLPDQLAFALVSSFLRISINAPQHRARCVNAIFDLAAKLGDALGATAGDAHTVIVKLVPLFNGLYRAIATTSFAWKLHEFARLADVLNTILTSTQTVRRLNEVLLLLEDQIDIRQQAGRATRRAPKVATVRPTDDQSEASVDTFFSGEEDEDADFVSPEGGFTYADEGSAAQDAQEYRISFLSRYRYAGTPLSGHYVLLASIDILSTTLAQALAVNARPPIKDFSDFQKLGLDLDRIDPSRQSQADRFDLDSDGTLDDAERSHSRAILAPGATKKAWDSLLRFSIHPNFAKSSSLASTGNGHANGHANGSAPQANGSANGSILAAVPVIGSIVTDADKSAAFGQADASPSAKLSLHDLDDTLWAVLRASNKGFHDVQRFLLSEGVKSLQVLPELHVPELLAETLKLSALCSVARSIAGGEQVDNNVFVRIRSLLSESSPIYDPRVQGAALQSVGVLVRNNNALALPMTRVLRHFVTSPIPIFLPSARGVSSPVLLSAARCLSTCVTIAPGDDLVVSTMYNLLNYLGRDTPGGLGVGGVAGSGASVRSGASRAVTSRDQVNGISMSGSQANISARSEDQRRLINLSTITVISRLALEVGKPDVTSLTISMLLQRLRNADISAEAAILDNIVPLALAGPRGAYVDVVRALSAVSRSALTGGANRRAAVAVESAQLKLARGLGRLDERDERDAAASEEEKEATGGRKEIFLIELLQLFAEKGMQLQTVASSTKSSKEELAELNTDLATLLPAIAAVLEHKDIHPEVQPTTEMVSLFRNMWFLSVLFGYASPNNIRSNVAADGSATHRPGSAAEAQAEIVGKSLMSISLKTPTLVPESAHNYLESDLEYNSVLKREFSNQTLDAQRKALSAVIPTHASDIRGFSYAQVTFLSTIYDLECLRSRMGRPSMVLSYFINEGLNSSALVGAMQAIADKVIEFFIRDLGQQVNKHLLDPRVANEVKNLMLGCCHRVSKVRQVSLSILNKLIYALPSLLCDQDVVTAMLEILTLLRDGCEAEFKDEFAPTYHYVSDRAHISFDLSDSYPQRNEILSSFLTKSREYLSLIMTMAPLELQGILERYLGTFDDSELPDRSELGKSIALEYARAMPVSARKEQLLPNLGGWRSDASSKFIGELSAKSTYLGEMTGIHLALTKGLVELSKDPTNNMSPASVAECREQLATLSNDVGSKKRALPFAELRRLLYRTAALVVALPEPDYELLHFIVSIPFQVFTPEAISAACQVWTWVIGARPEVETKVMVELTIGWAMTAKARKGLFSPTLTTKHPFLRKTEMGAFNREEITAESEQAARLFTPHLTLIHLIASRFQAFRYRDPTMVLTLVRLLQHSGAAVDRMSTHPLAREARFTLLNFGFRLIQTSQLEGLVEYHLRDALYKLGYGWFASSPQWSFGGNRLQLSADMQVMQETLELLQRDSMRADQHVTSFPPTLSSVRMPGGVTLQDAIKSFGDKKRLLQLLVENEVARLSVWANPLNNSARGSDFVGPFSKGMTDASWGATVESAWRVSPVIAVQLGSRFQSKALKSALGRLIRSQPYKVVDTPAALKYLLEDHLKLAKKESSDLKWLQYWAAVSPVEAIDLFQPEYENHPLVLQYAMRSLEQHPVELTFFYVPQVVQALRTDEYHYVEHFIFETSKISQLFCHQIIWNMKANSYKDDEAEEEDPMKPTLDRMVDNIVQALSGEAQDFYEREFGFFNEVTSISGKLKPFIKKSKPEKKAKIDEEMDKIKVDPGVYLPSNADGVVVDLDRKSGRPLQSHAKAPFMATFKVHREIVKPGDEGDENTPPKKTGVDVWQAAIFKVGDDCRQDVLALQVIAMFKNVYTTVGIDLYLNPYRVTATGPGCGVIDVVPNATSRDEMGRAKINHLLTFFIGKYGNTDSIAFQRARMNFIQSMAAYSVVCHILQIRDRHNGNMMIDGDGHLVHIDFGFLFDIGPGGMRFEPYSFKLSHEMIDVMGGPGSQGFRMFEELVVKAFLAARPFCDEIVDTCKLMLGTELPSFKGMPTIDRLRDRFKPELTEREAAQHAQWLVKDAYGNKRGVLYDKLQEVTNDIPFAK
ncbi:Phosphatidylinositol 3-/4-kinase, catalytic domain protein [Kalmanozyma brasiliensis GHG001]|nr:Phosphatidylinositol 3-/4-kinase, catalytic domain protein [Kalmanozyma brasiliensis GHG001]KAF6767202.1 Phosphatidylinositol 3-/4-kinase, catalytic domain protein [Kalmanozyma brasiliensis GHG001]